MTYETNITLDLSGEQYNPPVTAMQGDKDSRYIIATLTAFGQPYTIPTGTTARISVIKPHGECVLNDAQIEKGNVKILLTEQMLIDSGIARGEVMLFQGTALLSSAVFDLIIQEAAYDRDAIESAPEYNTFVDALAKMQGLTEEVQQATEEATTQAAYAKNQGDYAKEQGNEAKTQAASAKTQASAAQTAAGKANTAASAANSAASSANNAADRANTAAGEVEDIISDVNTAVSNKIDAEKGKALGLASLDSAKKVNETAKKADALIYNSTTVSADDLVITRGTNDKGDWIKFPDGTQICTMIKNITTDITDKWGYMYSSAEIDLGEYPLAFNASYPVIRQISMAKGEKERSLAAMWYLGDTIFPSSTTPGGIHFYRTSSEAGVNVNVHILAIGRWR